jgi:hypothetical protein
MKSTYTIAAIAMFAVILGMGALSPAMAGKDKVDLCHYSAMETIEEEIDGELVEVTIPEHWKTINISQNGKAVIAHETNHSQVNDDESITHDFQIITDQDKTDCATLMIDYPELEDKEEA